MVVLDEADKLFEVGKDSADTDRTFLGQIDEVLVACSHAKVRRKADGALQQSEVDYHSSFTSSPVLLGSAGIVQCHHAPTC